jgi:RNA polymerase sigma-70 factor, ECF subfamily
MDPEIPQHAPQGAAARTEQFDRRLEENVALLRRYVRAKTGATVRSREPVSDIVQSVVRAACEAPLDAHEDDAAFRSWLCTIAANKIISKNRFYSAERRDADRERSFGEQGRLVRDEAQLSPALRAERGEDLERLRGALDALDPTDREIVILRKLFDVPTPRIAERVSLSASTVRGRLARAMTELAARLA